MYKVLTLQDVAKEISKAIKHPDAYKPRTDGDPWIPIRDFLDDFYANPDKRQKMVWKRPPLTGDKHFDAYLAALAEYLCYHYNLTTPYWVEEKERFLDTWWFPTEFKSLHAIAFVESPASFRRRGIFVDHTEFQRV